MVKNFCTFQRFYLLSAVLVDSYFLSCSVCLPWAPAVASLSLMRMRYGNRTASAYHWARRKRLGSL